MRSILFGTFERTRGEFEQAFLHRQDADARRLLDEVLLEEPERIDLLMLRVLIAQGRADHLASSDRLAAVASKGNVDPGAFVTIVRFRSARGGDVRIQRALAARCYAVLRVLLAAGARHAAYSLAVTLESFFMAMTPAVEFPPIAEAESSIARSQSSRRLKTRSGAAVRRASG